MYCPEKLVRALHYLSPLRVKFHSESGKYSNILWPSRFISVVLTMQYLKRDSLAKLSWLTGFCLHFDVLWTFSEIVSLVGHICCFCHNWSPCNQPESLLSNNCTYEGTLFLWSSLCRQTLRCYCVQVRISFRRGSAVGLVLTQLWYILVGFFAKRHNFDKGRMHLKWTYQQGLHFPLGFSNFSQISLQH